MNEYIGIAVSFVLAAGIAAAMVVLGSTLGKKNPTAEKLAPFECGKDPFSLPKGRFAIKFYLVGILFILFDVELIFLYPWAVVYRSNCWRKNKIRVPRRSCRMPCKCWTHSWAT